MPSGEKAHSSSPVTIRAVCLGLLFSTVINLVMAYNDYYLYNSLLIGNHFPVMSLVAVMLLVLGLNAGLSRKFGIPELSSGELLLIWSMMGISGGICAAGIMRYFPSWVAVPTYYSNAANEYDVYIMKYIPDWMVLSRDPASRAVKWLMEGLPGGQRIPWAQWVVPMAMWFSFMACLFASNFSLVSVFYHQWAVRERLIFPVVQLPLQLTEAPARGERFNPFLGNPWTWVGFVIPCLIWGINGLRTFAPGIPAFPMTWYSWSLFPDRPWNELHLESINIYCTVIGLTFLLTTEIAFSLWFFYVLYKASFVWIAFLGSGATGFWGNWSVAVTTFETAGAMLAIAGFLVYSARGFLREWWGRVVSGVPDRRQDPISPRWALLMLVVGVAGMIGWFLLAGAQWWAAALGVGLFLVVLLVLTRVIAESGLIFVQSNVIPYDVLAGLFPPAWLTGWTLNSLMMQKAIVMNDLREIFMPYVMNGLKAAAQVRMHLGKVLAVFTLTAAVALGISAYGRIATYYKYGGVNMDQWANVWSPNGFLGNVASYQKNPPSYDFTRIGERRILPVNVMHVAVGGTLAIGMLVMRAWFLWWPLHPFGLVMCGAWAMSQFWFSILLGWMAKVCVMTFGGASFYRKALPFMLGMVLGESVIAAVWIAVGLVTGTPGIHILPN
jgi:hypothetical protein